MSRELWVGAFTVRLLGLIAFSASAFAQSSSPAPLPPHDKLLRAIYQELIEINTTDSVGDCTQ